MRPARWLVRVRVLAAATLSRSEFVELELEPGAPGSSQLSARAGRSTDNRIECSADACRCRLFVVAEESSFTRQCTVLRKAGTMPQKKRTEKGRRDRPSAEHSMRMSIQAGHCDGTPTNSRPSIT